MPFPLPLPFKDLEYLTDEWLLLSEAARMQKRFSSTFDHLRGFYDVFMPRIEAVLEFLDKCPLDHMTQEEQNLLNLSLSLCDVSVAIEKVGAVRGEFNHDAMRLEIVHEMRRRV